MHVLADPVHAPPRQPSPSPAPGLLTAAEAFVRLYAEEHPGTDPAPRLAAVEAEIARTGTYTHTPEELQFGARVAWRQAHRCIGRLYWNSLTVRDLRGATSPDEIAAQCVEHLRLATNRGRIRPVISVFAPDRPGRPAPRLLNAQLIRYACDPASARQVAAARAAGWKGGADRWDVLPLMVQPSGGGPPKLYELPKDAVLEVPLTHPNIKDFGSLGLRWYAVPAVADMVLEIGGIEYPCSPFSGWYMGTEIGARDLADTGRYNQLPVVARLMGLDTSSDRTLWRDRALVELNLAVLHSFAEFGVKIADHHTESQRFLEHIARERRHGRPVPADWSWIVPPMSGAVTPVFHRRYDPVNAKANPRFAHRPKAGCPFHS